MLAATRYGEPRRPARRRPGPPRRRGRGACSRSKAAARTASRTTRSSSATPGATSFRSSRPRDPAMRQRLLDASLAALARDFSTYRAGWFSRFHESLAPTDDERAAARRGLPAAAPKPRRPDGLVRRRGAEPDRARRPPRSHRCCSTGSVRSSRRRRPARRKQASTWSARPAARSPDEAGRAALVAADGLAHPLGRRPASRDRAHRSTRPGPGRRSSAAAVADRLPDVAESQRSAVAALVERLGGEPAPAVGRGRLPRDDRWRLVTARVRRPIRSGDRARSSRSKPSSTSPSR